MKCLVTVPRKKTSLVKPRVHALPAKRLMVVHHYKKEKKKEEEEEEKIATKRKKTENDRENNVVLIATEAELRQNNENEHRPLNTNRRSVLP